MNIKVIFREKECQDFLEKTLQNDFLPEFLSRVKNAMGEIDKDEPAGLLSMRRRDAMVQVIR